MGVVSGEPGQTWATEAHRTGPTSPHPELSPCSALPCQNLRTPFWKEGLSRLPLGARQSPCPTLYEGGAGPNSRPGLAEPGVDILSAERTGRPGLCSPPSPSPLL